MTEPGRVQHTHIGGQAVIEGIMMRGRYNWAIAVRSADGELHTEEHDLHPASARLKWLRWPFVRGVWGIYETMVLAMRAFSVSAKLAGETEEEQLTDAEVGWTMVLGLALAIGLFTVLPAFAAKWLVGRPDDNVMLWNLTNGVIRLVVLFVYIWAVSRVKEIERVFRYHGAEHKTIHAYEHGLPLDTAVIQEWETLHPRCGTSFLLMVMVVALVVYMLVPIKQLLIGAGVHSGLAATLVTILVHILLMPPIAGIAYEVIKWGGSHPGRPLVRVLMWPGLMLQKLTTGEPDDSMVEVAVAAMRLVVAREEREAAASGGAFGAPDADNVLADAP